MAIKRVKNRVEEGGHHIPKDVIKRRYFRGIKNLFEIYLSEVDLALIYDNSFGNHQIIAEKTKSQLNILDKEKFIELKNLS